MNQLLTINCPTCGIFVKWTTTNHNQPFCSDRCKLIDLGAWASEKYKIQVKSDIKDEIFPEDLPLRN
ncbi:DNA gyrase inhibitor YacG [Candidatus Pseudomonas adelgestsugas]|uniref:DNA gyrase inhibitor YacG n=1 Tax=Candidatus Pseudomonas adelgestsugas TaxID=1302376 RepID=A0ABX5R890_9PSED|nr:DNA gyrase inhibitor YacG [Candidatus Pseudomonas adelgestsugas]QAX81773.1 DNA gyrase inhibitor YacG [Candidatus Pseudomonas adelgestsugas]